MSRAYCVYTVLFTGTLRIQQPEPSYPMTLISHLSWLMVHDPRLEGSGGTKEGAAENAATAPELYQSTL